MSTVGFMIATFLSLRAPVCTTLIEFVEFELKQGAGLDRLSP